MLLSLLRCLVEMTASPLAKVALPRGPLLCVYAVVRPERCPHLFRCLNTYGANGG